MKACLSFDFDVDGLQSQKLSDVCPKSCFHAVCMFLTCPVHLNKDFHPLQMAEEAFV